MNFSKLIASASLALAIIGGSFAFAPASAQAGGKSFIKYPVLGNGGSKGKAKLKPANPYTRGCSATSRCQRG